MMTARTSSPWADKPLPGGHRLLRVISSSARGEVWEAEAAGRRVALKFLRYDRASADLRGLLLIKRLDHPYLLRIDGVVGFPGYVVVTMELADCSLADLMAACRDENLSGLPAAPVCEYLTQAADALDFLNARRHPAEGRAVGIQHADVKPGNLLVVGNTVKVGDFGRATALPTASVQHPRPGAAAYAAPEVFAGKLCDRTDQYALAVCYCELRGGRLPFPDPGRISPSYLRPRPDLSMLSLGEARVVARALAQSPQDRWPSCTELMARLTERILVEAVAASGPGPDSFHSSQFPSRM
jgi:serine/threonine protein kinase